METKIDKERRIYPRIPVGAKCWVQRDSVTLLGTVTNVSFGGLFIRTWVSIADGSDVELKIDIGNADIEIKGRVVWSATKQGESQHQGLGIEFDESTDGMTIVSRLRGSKIPKPN